MKNFIGKMRTAFAKEESGAVTVDWVVLVSAIVGLSIAVIATTRRISGQKKLRLALVTARD